MEIIFKELAKKYPTPEAVQTFIHQLPYNAEETKITQRSALETLKAGTAHCLEGALLSAAILEYQNYPPLIVSMESVDLLDHVVYVFKQNHLWGAIGKSRDQGLNGRKPSFRSIRDLVWSYVDPYVDQTGRLKAYQLFDLNQLKFNWRYSKNNLWALENYLIEAKHLPLKASSKRHQKIKERFLKQIPLRPQDCWW